MERLEYIRLARLIDRVAQPDFPDQFADWLKSKVPLDLLTVVIYRGDQRPLHIFDDFPSEAGRAGMQRFLNQTYILNAFFQAHRRGLVSGVYRLRDLAPDAYLHSEVYREYEVVFTEQEEIGYVTEGWPSGQEEIDIAIALGSGSTVEIGLYRLPESGTFSPSELAELNDLLPLIEAAFRQYWAAIGPTKPRRAELDRRWTDDAFASFAKSSLSERERQVAGFILRGHSSESITSHLDISITTVKTHRKRTYEKLNISTQAELLSLFLDHIQIYLVEN